MKYLYLTNCLPVHAGLMSIV